MNANPPVDLACGDARVRILPADGLMVSEFTIGTKPVIHPDGIVEIRGKKKRRGGIPVLFPQAGSVSDQPEGFNLSQHGFARDMPWETLFVSGNLRRAEFGIRSGPATREKYPFDFELRAAISVEPDALDYRLVFQNPSPALIWAAPGLHPYFAIPAGVGSESETPTLEAPEALIRDAGTWGAGCADPAGARDKLRTNVSGFSIDTYRVDESIILPPQRVDLDVPQLGRVSMVPGKDFLRTSSRLVVWSDHPGYMCFEPWSAGVGALFNERQRVELPPRHESLFTMRIEVKR